MSIKLPEIDANKGVVQQNSYEDDDFYSSRASSSHVDEEGSYHSETESEVSYDGIDSRIPAGISKTVESEKEESPVPQMPTGSRKSSTLPESSNSAPIESTAKSKSRHSQLTASETRNSTRASENEEEQIVATPLQEQEQFNSKSVEVDIKSPSKTPFNDKLELPSHHEMTNISADDGGLGSTAEDIVATPQSTRAANPQYTRAETPGSITPASATHQSDNQSSGSPSRLSTNLNIEVGSVIPKSAVSHQSSKQESNQFPLDEAPTNMDNEKQDTPKSALSQKSVRNESRPSRKSSANGSPTEFKVDSMESPKRISSEMTPNVERSVIQARNSSLHSSDADNDPQESSTPYLQLKEKEAPEVNLESPAQKAYTPRSRSKTPRSKSSPPNPKSVTPNLKSQTSEAVLSRQSSRLEPLYNSDGASTKEGNKNNGAQLLDSEESADESVTNFNAANLSKINTEPDTSAVLTPASLNKAPTSPIDQAPEEYVTPSKSIEAPRTLEKVSTPSKLSTSPVLAITSDEHLTSDAIQDIDKEAPAQVIVTPRSGTSGKVSRKNTSPSVEDAKTTPKRDSISPPVQESKITPTKNTRFSPSQEVRISPTNDKAAFDIIKETTESIQRVGSKTPLGRKSQKSNRESPDEEDSSTSELKSEPAKRSSPTTPLVEVPNLNTENEIQNVSENSAGVHDAQDVEASEVLFQTCL